MVLSMVRLNFNALSAMTCILPAEVTYSFDLYLCAHPSFFAGIY